MQCMPLALLSYAILCKIIIAVYLLLLLHCVRAIACMFLLVVLGFFSWFFLRDGLFVEMWSEG